MSAPPTPAGPSTQAPTDAGLRARRDVRAGGLGPGDREHRAECVIAFNRRGHLPRGRQRHRAVVLLATLVILAVGYCVVVFARKHASAGSLYTYVAKGLGPPAPISPASHLSSAAGASRPARSAARCPT